jgi:protein-S-isoprenylcysteine O-methyltransferase Ste14
MDPREAIGLLEQTQRRARQEFDFRSPWLSLLAAAVVLLGFGAVWLSVRAQHPYRGPSAASLVVLYALVALRIATVLRAKLRAGAGLTGRSVQLAKAEGAALVVSLAAVYVLMAGLISAGARHPAFYWLYGLSATLIVLGAFWSARCAVRADWPGLTISLGVMAIASGSSLAGPRGMWLSDGIGCCVLLIGYSAAQVLSPRAGHRA